MKSNGPAIGVVVRAVAARRGSATWPRGAIGANASTASRVAESRKRRADIDLDFGDMDALPYRGVSLLNASKEIAISHHIGDVAVLRLQGPRLVLLRHPLRANGID